jgi:hypothetical protein
MSRYSPIITLSYKTQDEAIEGMYSLNYENISKTNSGIQVITIGENNEIDRDKTEDIFFEAKTVEANYNFTIEKHSDAFVLQVYRTYKHKMITGSIVGDLELFIENFDNRRNMIEFSLSNAIIYDHWNIVKYLIENYEFKEKPIWLCIRYDRVKILNNLLSKGGEIPNDWLAYCLYSNSTGVTRELVDVHKLHHQHAIDEIKTSWLIKELRKDTELVKYVKKSIPELE